MYIKKFFAPYAKKARSSGSHKNCSKFVFNSKASLKCITATLVFHTLDSPKDTARPCAGWFGVFFYKITVC